MTQAREKQLPFLSHRVGETVEMGRLLGQATRPGDVILLHGPLGAGKTALTQGIAAGMGIQTPVTSPSFTILKEYNEPGRLPLAHFDFYRIDARRAVDVEFSDYVGGSGVCVIEWATRVPQIIPPSYLDVMITRLPNMDTQERDDAALSQADAEGQGWRYIDITAVGQAVEHLYQALANLDVEQHMGPDRTRMEMQ